MTQTAHVLELNGRQYDAMTGALLSNSPKSLDGMVRAQPAQKPAVTHPRVTNNDLRTPTEPAGPKVGFMDIQRVPAHHTQHHQQQHSKTLMRSAVQPPAKSLKRQAKATTHTGALAKTAQFDIIPKHAATAVDPVRLQRAGTVSRSDLVQRFAPAAKAKPSVNSLSRGTATYEPRVAPQPASEPEPIAAPTKKQPSDDVFERALATANSHKQPYVKAKHRSRKVHRLRQITSIAASALAIILIAGFVAYQNTAFIQLRLASSRAGISATMPSWQPSGFHIGAFTTSPGTVTVSYQRPGSDQHYSISQSASSWDSATLLSEYVYPHNDTYNTITSGGTTIYTYGDNNATWVNGGIWYKLTDNGNLSTSQVVNIATSM